MKKKYHLSDILSITTGVLVSSRHMEGVYDILNYMTGDNLYTHQLGRAMFECRPWLKTQYPQLNDIDASGVNPDNWKSWLEENITQCGEYFDIEPLPKGIHDVIDPLTELSRMIPKEKIIVLESEKPLEKPSETKGGKGERN